MHTKWVDLALLASLLVGIDGHGQAAGIEPASAATNGTRAPAARTLRVAGAQMAVTRNIATNLATILRAISFAAGQKADVLVTPEGSLSGYTSSFDPAATDRALDEVRQRARQANLALVLGTCFAGTDGARYDAQRFFDRAGNDLGFHAKILLCRWMADPRRQGEVDTFKTAPLRTFALEGLTVGGLICNDMWANPEWTPMPDPYLARQLGALGARVLFLSVNSGQDEGEALALHRAFHESNLRLRTRSARLWVVVANAADPDGRREANCHSGVLDPDGNWVIQADPKGERFFVQDVTVQGR